MSGWFHCKVGKIQRSSGRSSVAAAAYRSGTRLVDERTGQVHDYRAKGGVLHCEIVAPDDAPDWMQDREKLWNGGEAAEKRKDAVTAREVELALPADVTDAERLEITREMAGWLCDRYGFVVDFAIHRPSMQGDDRNHHAHLMMTVRGIEGRGFAAKKNRALDDKVQGPVEITAIREAAANIINRALERAGTAERVDHRSLDAQGVDREATQHLGPAASQMERRGEPTRIGTGNRKIRVFGSQRDALRRDLARIERSIKIEQGRNVHGIRRGPRPIDKPFNWTARDGVKDAAQRLKSTTGEARASMKAQHAQNRDSRKAELTRYYAERRAMRDELKEKYRAALDGIWNRPASDGLAVATTTGPAIRPEVERMAVCMNEREGRFRSNESTMRGRWQNARSLAGDKASFWRVARLAIDGRERHRAFTDQQQSLQATVRSAPPPQGPPRAKTPEPQHVLATRKTAEIKAERFAVLDAHEKQTRAGADAIKERHGAAIAAEREQRAALSGEIGQQWRDFRHAYGLTPDPSRPFARAAADPSRVPDWKGLRDLQPRAADATRSRPSQPEPSRQGQEAGSRTWGASAKEWRAHWNQQEAKEDRERAERQETTPDASQAFQQRSTGQETPSETKPAPASSAEAGHEGQSWTAEDVARFQQIKADRAAERSAPSQEHDPGRTL